MPPKILIVDDEPGIRNVLTSLLKERGFETATAGTAAEGLKAVSEDNYNVIVLDIILPDAAGTQILDKLDKASPDSEVVLITGHASLDTAIQALRNKSYDYIQKPFRLGQLLEAIEGALEHQRLTLENRRMLEQLKFLNNISSQIVKTLDLDAVLKQLLYQSMNFFSADSGAIYLKNGQQWMLRQYSGVTKRFVTEFGALASDHPIVRDAANARVSITDGSNGHSGSSWASVPLMYLERPLGVMILTVKSGKRFDDEDKRLLSIVGAQAGSYIYNSVLYGQAEETRNYLEGLIRNTAESIITYSLDGRVKTWNDAAAQTYGYSEKEAIGRYMIIIPEDKLDEVRHILARVGNGEIVNNYETLRRRKDGTLIPVMVTYSPVKDASGKVVGISTISRDVTIMHQMEQEQVRTKVLEAKSKIREIIIDVVPLLMRRQIPEAERNEFISLLSTRLEETIYDDYLGGKEKIELDTMGESIARVFNDLGGEFTSQVEGDEVVITGKRCPWANESRRNPVTCMLTKSISARFAKRAWGGAKVQVTKTLANKDDCCRIVIKRSG
ncbi:MAG: response regulator [Methanomassiliicoccales archaeon]|nr:response regulator [Methanomassiliicoccales archaeon]